MRRPERARQAIGRLAQLALRAGECRKLCRYFAIRALARLVHVCQLALDALERVLHGCQHRVRVTKEVLAILAERIL
jgi:hypothetical protein